MSYWSDGTPRSNGNAFDIPAIVQPETKQQRRNRLHREAAAKRKPMQEKAMRVNKWIESDPDKQKSADKTAKIKGKP